MWKATFTFISFSSCSPGSSTLSKFSTLLFCHFSKWFLASYFFSYHLRYHFHYLSVFSLSDSYDFFVILILCRSIHQTAVFSWRRSFLLVTRYSFLFTCYSLFLLFTRNFLLITHCFLLVTRYFLLVTCYFLLVTHCYLLFLCCYLLGTHEVLFVKHCIMFIMFTWNYTSVLEKANKCSNEGFSSVGRYCLPWHKCNCI